MNTKTIILNHLLSGNEITPLDASKSPFNTMYLASYIRDLRNDGHNIEDRKIKSPTGKYYNSYFILTLAKLVGGYHG